MAYSSGRILAADGSTVNIADVLGGTPTGETADIEKMSPHSGNFVNEAGQVVNIAKSIGHGGGSQELKALTITLGGETVSYDGTEAVNIEISNAAGVAF